MILKKYKRKGNKLTLKFEDCSKIVLKLEEKDFIDVYGNEIGISKGEELNIKYLYSTFGALTDKEQKLSDKYVLFGNFGEIHFRSEQIIKMESENEPIRNIWRIIEDISLKHEGGYAIIYDIDRLCWRCVENKYKNYRIFVDSERGMDICRRLNMIKDSYILYDC